MRLLALDPGGTTGVCVHYTEIGSWYRSVLGPGPHHGELEELIEAVGEDFWDAIIYERFQYQRRELSKGVSLVLDSVEYIGVIKLCAAKMPNVPLIEQTPAQAKNFWSNDKLKKLGLYVTTSEHERDATRHMLYFLTMHPEGPHDRSYIERLK